jgi:carbonic anhydrase
MVYTFGMSDQTNDVYARVLENNRKWVAAKRASDCDFFKNLSREQTPEFLYIGCADSRVPANEIMGLEPGEVFVHRNIANLVPNTDMNVHAVIQYAVEQLGVRHVIVCGHYGCGGVQAAMQSKDLGQLNGWLREIRDVYRLHQVELNAIEDKTKRYRRLVELNVQEQCVNVIKTAWVQRSFRTRGYPIVHGWCYALEDGVLHDLEIPFVEIFDQIREIYNLDDEIAASGGKPA